MFAIQFGGRQIDVEAIGEKQEQFDGSQRIKQVRLVQIDVEVGAQVRDVRNLGHFCDGYQHTVGERIRQRLGVHNMLIIVVADASGLHQRDETADQ